MFVKCESEVGTVSVWWRAEVETETARRAATTAHVAAAHSCSPDTATVLLAPKGDDAATPQLSPNLSGTELVTGLVDRISLQSVLTIFSEKI